MSRTPSENTNAKITSKSMCISHFRTEFIEIPEVLRERARIELGETEEKLASCIKAVRERIRNHRLPFPDDDESITPFIRARKFDCKRTIESITAYTVIMKQIVQKHGLPDTSNILKALKKNAFGFLPYKDEQGRVITYWRAGSKMRDGISKRDAIHAILVMMFLVLKDPHFQISGFIFITDVSSLTFSEILNEIDFARTLLPVMRCDPARFQGLHCVKEGLLADFFMGIGKKLLPPKLAKRMKFHGTRLEELYEFFSPDILPEEFGGTLGPISNDHWIEAAFHATSKLSEHLQIYYT